MFSLERVFVMSALYYLVMCHCLNHPVWLVIVFSLELTCVWPALYYLIRAHTNGDPSVLCLCLAPNLKPPSSLMAENVVTILWKLVWYFVILSLCESCECCCIYLRSGITCINSTAPPPPLIYLFFQVLWLQAPPRKVLWVPGLVIFTNVHQLCIKNVTLINLERERELNLFCKVHFIFLQRKLLNSYSNKMAEVVGKHVCCCLICLLNISLE